MPKKQTSEWAFTKLNYNYVRFEVLGVQLYIYTNTLYWTHGNRLDTNFNKAIV